MDPTNPFFSCFKLPFTPIPRGENFAFILASGKLKSPERKRTIDLLRAQVMVSIQNHQLYRHIEQPGWRLSWSWAGKEVIWDARGAEATEQGDCSRVGGGSRPHCCQKRPVMADLPPGTPFNQQVANCCRDGVLSSLTQNNLTSAAAFQMVVGQYAVRRRPGRRRQGARDAVELRHRRAGVLVQQRHQGAPDQDQGRHEPPRPSAP